MTGFTLTVVHDDPLPQHVITMIETDIAAAVEEVAQLAPVAERYETAFAAHAEFCAEQWRDAP